MGIGAFLSVSPDIMPESEDCTFLDIRKVAAIRRMAVIKKLKPSQRPSNAAVKKPRKASTIKTVGIVAATIRRADLEKGRLATLHTSLRKTISTARRVARCMASPYPKPTSIFINRPTRIMCPLLEIGKNSVSPCINPMTMACHILIVIVYS